jgi:hypothetical protein
MFGLVAAGVLGPNQPTTYELAEGPKALVELEARATVGKLALLPEQTRMPTARPYRRLTYQGSSSRASRAYSANVVSR